MKPPRREVLQPRASDGSRYRCPCCQPRDALHPFFPHFGGGVPFNPERLRMLNPGHTFPPAAPGTWYGTCLLDRSQQGLTYCALLRDDHIVDFFFVERLQ